MTRKKPPKVPFPSVEELNTTDIQPLDDQEPSVGGSDDLLGSDPTGPFRPQGGAARVQSAGGGPPSPGDLNWGRPPKAKKRTAMLPAGLLGSAPAAPKASGAPARQLPPASPGPSKGVQRTKMGLGTHIGIGIGAPLGSGAPPLSGGDAPFERAGPTPLPPSGVLPGVGGPPVGAPKASGVPKQPLGVGAPPVGAPSSPAKNPRAARKRTVMGVGLPAGIMSSGGSAPRAPSAPVPSAPVPSAPVPSAVAPSGLGFPRGTLPGLPEMEEEEERTAIGRRDVIAAELQRARRSEPPPPSTGAGPAVSVPGAPVGVSAPAPGAANQGMLGLDAGDLFQDPAPSELFDGQAELPPAQEGSNALANLVAGPELDLRTEPPPAAAAPPPDALPAAPPPVAGSIKPRFAPDAGPETRRRQMKPTPLAGQPLSEMEDFVASSPSPATLGAPAPTEAAGAAFDKTMAALPEGMSLPIAPPAPSGAPGLPPAAAEAAGGHVEPSFDLGDEVSALKGRSRLPLIAAAILGLGALGGGAFLLYPILSDVLSPPELGDSATSPSTEEEKPAEGETAEAQAAEGQAEATQAAEAQAEEAQAAEAPAVEGQAEEAAATAEPAAAEAAVEQPPPAEPAAAGPIEEEDLPRGRRDAAEELAKRAMASMAEKDFGRAQARLEMATDKDASAHRVMAAWAHYYLAKGKPAQAKEWAEKALARRGRRAKYHVLMGDVYQALGEEGAARASYRRALSIEPDNGAARRGLR